MDATKLQMWDTIIKGLGLGATAVSIYIGIVHFNQGQKQAADLEFNRNFWQKQNEVFSEVCKKAGAMAANIDNEAEFEKEKKEFSSMYYGEMVLVEDATVDSMMRELKSYIEILEPKDPNMAIVFKRKVLELANACKNSSQTFKRRNLQ
jgi:hypothetical protein